jgi:hypothetical protein
VGRLFKKGQPRPPTAGRKLGTPNRVTTAIGEAARQHSPIALQRLVQLMKHRDGHIALKAIGIVLAYGFGRPAQCVELAETESSHAYVFHFNYPYLYLITARRICIDTSSREVNCGGPDVKCEQT